MKKRYQYFGRGGIKKWTKWFTIDDDTSRPKYQINKKLINEYKDE